MGRRISGRLAAVAITAAGLVPAGLAVSAGAAAIQPATLSVDQTCYVITSSVPTMTITGTGYTPDLPVVITSSSGKLSTKVTADANGDITASVAAPSPRLTSPRDVLETLTATQTPAPGQQIVGTTHTYVTALGASHGATRKLPGLKALTETTTWNFSGFPVGKTIWVHYLFKGKQVAEQSFGKAPAPCGVLHVRKPLFPGTPQHPRYPVQIDTSKPLVTNTAPKITRLVVGLQLEF